MKNLRLQTFLILGSIWMLTSLKCSTTPVTLQGFPLKSIKDIELSNITKRLEENQTQAILWEKQLTYQLRVREKDGLYLKPSFTQDSLDLVLPTLSSTLIPMTSRMQMSFGRTNTVGNTLINE